MRNLIARVLPMRFVEYRFTDVVSGLSVNLYEEKISGRTVLAETRWSLFRVEITN